jgi:hypothetical protein
VRAQVEGALGAEGELVERLAQPGEADAAGAPAAGAAAPRASPPASPASCAMAGPAGAPSVPNARRPPAAPRGPDRHWSRRPQRLAQQLAVDRLGGPHAKHGGRASAPCRPPVRTGIAPRPERAPAKSTGTFES